MQKIMIVFVALAIGFVLGSRAWSEHLVPSMIAGNRYLKENVDFQAGYLAGASDVYCLFADTERSARGIRFCQCVRDMRLPQIHAILEKYLKNHPEEWHMAMSAIVYEAVTESCPE
jgi:hypothetical protein